MFNQNYEPVLFENDLIEIRRTRFGLMAYLRNDVYIGHALAKYGEYSYGEYDIFRQIIRPGQTVLDVGANIGAHTLAMAQLVGPEGKVFAFEPQPIVSEVLGMNVLLNQAPHIVVYRSPLMDTFQKMYLPVLDYRQQANFGDVAASMQPTDVVVFSTRLDDYALPACHFIKIDVQGAELAVLKGAEATLARYRPFLYVENDRVDTSSALISGLLSWDYVLYWHSPPLYNPNNYFGNSNNSYPGIASFNMLCVPKELVATIELPPVTGPEDNFEQYVARMRQASA